MLEDSAEFVACGYCVKCADNSLLQFTDELLWHVFELHEQGVLVSSHIVCCKASDFCCN